MTKKAHPSAHGIALKKKYGQHFLREQIYIDHMIDAVDLTPDTSVMEIGCGDGFLSRSILQQPIKQLWIFEIDQSWADYVRTTYADERLTIHLENILDTDLTALEPHAPWTLLANLPYQITFPLLYKLAEHRTLFGEGVIMVQEEVAQKIVKSSGRGYGFASLYLQYYFDWRVLDKVPPQAFYPPPKVDSRLLYFRPIYEPEPIPDAKKFWVFIKRCFAQPRRTLRNNLQSFHYPLTRISDEILALRAQQMSIEDFLAVWKSIM